MKRRPLLTLLSSGLLLLATAAAVERQGEGERNAQTKAVVVTPGRPQPLILPGPEPDVEILFTGDVQGFYQPCG